MKLKLLKNNQYGLFRKYLDLNKKLFFRLFLYLSIASIFFLFMNNFSPLGMNWRPFYFERFVNAIRNIFENTQLSIIGLTSWSDVDDVKMNLNNNLGNIYIVPSITYIFPSFLYKYFGNFNFLNYAYIFDYLFISFTGFIIAELGLKILFLKSNFDEIFYGLIIFALFITSPWTYRMVLAPWHEVSFLGFYILSNYFFLNNKKIFGLSFLFLSILMSWIWGILLFLFFLFIFLVSIIYNHFEEGSFKYKYVPLGLKNKKGFSLFISIISIPLLLNFIQKLCAKIIGINATNSNFLFRVGIDNLDNIHHGGLLGAFQFLGGNRLSLCFGQNNFNQFNNIENYISVFNCSLSITSQILLSLFSIFGVILILKNNPNYNWIFLPIFWCFIFYCLIFQQSFSVHLQGHSYIFALFFSIGITYFIQNSLKILQISDILEKIIIIPIISGILINSVRVCYFTGING